MKKGKKLVFKLSVLFYLDIFAIKLDFFIQSIALALYYIIVSFFL